MDKQEDHNQGQKDGAKASAFDEVVENFNPFSSQAYKDGFKHGVSKQDHSSDDSGGGSGGSGSSGGICLVSTACSRSLGLPDDCEELVALRNLRDRYVLSLPEGHRYFEEYKALAPSLIRAVEASGCAPQLWKWVYESLVLPTAELAREGRFKEAFAHYRKQFRLLRRRYAAT